MPTLESNPRETCSPSERVFTAFIAGTERMTAAHSSSYFVVPIEEVSNTGRQLWGITFLPPLRWPWLRLPAMHRGSPRRR